MRNTELYISDLIDLDYHLGKAKSRAFRKLDNLKDLQYMTDLEIINDILKKYREKSENKDLKILQESLLNITLYVNELQNDRELLINGYKQNRDEKLIALEKLQKQKAEKDTL